MTPTTVRPRKRAAETKNHGVTTAHPSPCQLHHCSKCCWETEMTLSNEDIARIERAGYRDFYTEQDGYLVLKNKERHCFFLKNGRCQIYDIRPAGCRVYPLVLDLNLECVVWHEFCPHRNEFEYDAVAEQILIDVLEVEERERIERTRTRAH